MKKINRLFGILTMAALTGFLMAGCDIGTSHGSRKRAPAIIDIEITGIKHYYDWGEPLDFQAVTVTIRYSDGTEREFKGFTQAQLLEEGIELSGYNANVSGPNHLYLSYGGFTGDPITVTVGPAPINAPTAAVSMPAGSAREGEGGVISYTVDTTNIASGTYNAAVVNAATYNPTEGISVLNNSVTVPAGALIVEVAAGVSAALSPYSLRLILTVDNKEVVSESFTLIVTPPLVKTVAFAAGSTSKTVEAGGTTPQIYIVTTVNIADGAAGSVTWYSNAGGTSGAATALPPGISSAAVSPVSDNIAAVTINSTGYVTGTYWFRVTIDSAVSPNVAELEVTGAEEGDVSYTLHAAGLSVSEWNSNPLLGSGLLPVNLINKSYTNTEVNNGFAYLAADSDGIHLFNRSEAQVRAFLFAFGSDGTLIDAIMGKLNTQGWVFAAKTDTADPFDYADIVAIKRIDESIVTSTSWYTNNPDAATFRIVNAEQLAYLAELVNGGTRFSGRTILQTAGINLNNSEWIPIGNSTRNFLGTYDGGNNTISNLKIYNTTDNYQGLFGYIGKDATVRNLTLSVNIAGRSYVGAVAGYNNGTIRNCVVSGSVRRASIIGSNVGCVTGYNSGAVANCTVTASISSSDLPTGYSTGGVTGVNNSTGTVSNCTVSGNVACSDTFTGGVAGSNYGVIWNCYANGKVSGNDSVGGLVGYNYNTVQYCVALNSSISGNTSAHGRVAGENPGNLVNNYARVGMTGGTSSTDPGSIHGANISAGTDGYNGQEFWESMGWNFSTVWEMSDDANSLPVLKREP